MKFTTPFNIQSIVILVAKPLGLLIFFSLILEFFQVDKTLADFIFQLEGNQWDLKNAWITATFIHKGGKYFSMALLLIVLTMLLISSQFITLKPWKQQLKYLFIATVLGTLFICIGKTFSNISCPWDFTRYGGTLEYLSLAEQLSIRNGSQCFPAGHASAGFAWVALYFVGLHSGSPLRWWGLAFAIVLGCTFGISQQLRGAHFLSHDLWSFGICWMVSLICYQVMLKPNESAR